MSDLTKFTASALVEAFRTGALTPTEATRSCLRQMKDSASRLNAFAVIDEEGALSAARAADTRWRRNAPLGPLDGVPVAAKDNMPVKGLSRRIGSTTIPDDPDTFDAPYVDMLKRGGAVFVGKTTTSEYCWTGATFSRLNGVTRNPWNLERGVGGSSGGAGAAVAGGLVPVALGTDAGGSVRTPAALCGVVGFKSSLGAVPQHAAEGFSSLNSVGALARTVADAATTFHIMRGRVAGKPATADTRNAPNRLRVAVSPSFGYGGYIDPAVTDAVNAAAGIFQRIGFQVEHAEPDPGDPVSIFNTLAWTEQAYHLAPVVARCREALDERLVELVEIGGKIPLSKYLDAAAARWELANRIRVFQEDYDLLLVPSVPIAALRAEEISPVPGSPEIMNDWLPFSSVFNLTGQPSISLPAGLNAERMPVAVQLVGRMGEDDVVLRAARLLEQELVGNSPLSPP